MIIIQPEASDVQALLLGLKFSGSKHSSYTANRIFVKKKKDSVVPFFFNFE